MGSVQEVVEEVVLPAKSENQEAVKPQTTDKQDSSSTNKKPDEETQTVSWVGLF